MSRTSSAYGIKLLENLREVYYCYEHDRYHYCNGDEDCVYEDNTCVFSGKTTKDAKMVLRAAGYINTDHINAGEMKMLQFKDKNYFRNTIHAMIMERHGKILKGSLEKVTRPTMEITLAGLHIFLTLLFMPNQEEMESFPLSRKMATLSLEKKLSRFDDTLVKICDLFVEASLVDHETKQQILFTMHQEPKHAKELRRYIAKVILAILTTPRNYAGTSLKSYWS